MYPNTFCAKTLGQYFRGSDVQAIKRHANNNDTLNISLSLNIYLNIIQHHLYFRNKFLGFIFYLNKEIKFYDTRYFQEVLPRPSLSKMYHRDQVIGGQQNGGVVNRA